MLIRVGVAGNNLKAALFPSFGKISSYSASVSLFACLLCEIIINVGIPSRDMSLFMSVENFYIYAYSTYLSSVLDAFIRMPSCSCLFVFFFIKQWLLLLLLLSLLFSLLFSLFSLFSVFNDAHSHDLKEAMKMEKAFVWLVNCNCCVIQYLNSWVCQYITISLSTICSYTNSLNCAIKEERVFVILSRTVKVVEFLLAKLSLLTAGMSVGCRKRERGEGHRVLWLIIFNKFNAPTFTHLRIAAKATSAAAFNSMAVAIEKYIIKIPILCFSFHPSLSLCLFQTDNR